MENLVKCSEKINPNLDPGMLIRVKEKVDESFSRKVRRKLRIQLQGNKFDSHSKYLFFFKDILKILNSDSRDLFRNVAIIAHVDHGKTTLVDALLRGSGCANEYESMDSN